MPEPWRRHDLLRVRPEAWDKVLCSRPHLADVPHVARWAARGWPVIVRRYLQEEDPTMIPVGFPLPPVHGKLRLSALVAPEVVEQVPPLALRDVRYEVPSDWQETVDALLELAHQSGVHPRVFGSLLWQRLTGLAYLAASSVLDLLWPVEDANSAAHLVRRLATIEQDSAVRCDGEILLPDGGGVQWREWRDSPHEVLVKTSTAVRLCATTDLFSAETPKP